MYIPTDHHCCNLERYLKDMLGAVVAPAIGFPAI
jgi:hypothetical protein